MLKKKLQFITVHPLKREIDLDLPETTLRRRRIIEKKSFLRKFYHECYLSVAKSLPRHVDGPILALGSGAGFLKEHIPGLLTSEIITVPNLDLILDGTKLPFSSNTLGGVVMIDVLHHISDAASFFRCRSLHKTRRRYHNDRALVKTLVALCLPLPAP